jgi:hypothetical protein
MVNAKKEKVHTTVVARELKIIARCIHKAGLVLGKKPTVITHTNRKENTNTTKMCSEYLLQNEEVIPKIETKERNVWLHV